MCLYQKSKGSMWWGHDKVWCERRIQECFLLRTLAHACFLVCIERWIYKKCLFEVNCTKMSQMWSFTIDESYRPSVTGETFRPPKPLSIHLCWCLKALNLTWNEDRVRRQFDFYWSWVLAPQNKMEITGTMMKLLLSGAQERTKLMQTD